MKFRRRFRVIALLMVAPAIGFAFGAKKAMARLPAQQTPVVNAPAGWVEFSADVTIEKPSRDSVFGRFYRKSDGSKRMESGPTRGDNRVIYILNVAEGTQYTYTQQEGWIAHAVTGLGDDYQPQRSIISSQVSKHPHRLAIAKGQSGALDATEGFSAYQMSTADGTTRLMVPELNLFDVSLRSGNGRTEQYSNIDLAEPPADLFRPPAGAVVSHRGPWQRGVHR